MPVKIYHNPRCKKSRAGLDYLEKKTGDIEIIDYIKTGISVEEVSGIIKMISPMALDLIRTQEEFYKKELKSGKFSNEEWAEIISQNPKLLKRPVVIRNNKAVIGDPAQNIDNLFK